jgi:hypothetical protein
MAARIERMSDLRARISWLVLSAPDQFPTTGSFGDDQRKNLTVAFDIVQDGFHLLEKKIKDPAQLCHLRALLGQALVAYQDGESTKGAHLLQDIQSIVFPNRFIKRKVQNSADAL